MIGVDELCSLLVLRGLLYLAVCQYNDWEMDLLHRRYLAILRIAGLNHHLLVLIYP